MYGITAKCNQKRNNHLLMYQKWNLKICSHRKMECLESISETTWKIKQPTKQSEIQESKNKFVQHTT